jgi:hypothetical protein
LDWSLQVIFRVKRSKFPKNKQAKVSPKIFKHTVNGRLKFRKSSK